MAFRTYQRAPAGTDTNWEVLLQKLYGAQNRVLEEWKQLNSTLYLVPTEFFATEPLPSFQDMALDPIERLVDDRAGAGICVQRDAE